MLEFAAAVYACWICSTGRTTFGPKSGSGGRGRSKHAATNMFTIANAIGLQQSAHRVLKWVPGARSMNMIFPTTLCLTSFNKASRD